jgi:dihydrofolate reductase
MNTTNYVQTQNTHGLIAIVATTGDGLIGLNDHLVYYSSEDMAWFKQHTEHNIVVMGRKTFESLPKLLANRVHIVLSRDMVDTNQTDVVVVRTPVEAYTVAIGLARATHKRAYVIGGAVIYREMLPYCDAALVTLWKAPVLNTQNMRTARIELSTWDLEMPYKYALKESDTAYYNLLTRHAQLY